MCASKKHFIALLGACAIFTFSPLLIAESNNTTTTKATQSTEFISENGTNRSSPNLSFAEAVKRIEQISNALHAAKAGFASRSESAESLKSLDYPELVLDVSGISYEKTLNSHQGSIDNVWVNGASVPGSTSSFSARYRQTTVRPMLVAIWPIYTGGLTSARQRAAQAMVSHADATVESTREALLTALVDFYFGYQLSIKVEAAYKGACDGLKLHLDNALSLEKHGIITQAQRLQAQVAYDAALRAYENASFERIRAATALAGLLRCRTDILPTTPLFIIQDNSRLESLPAFMGKARENSPVINQLSALHEAAKEGIEVEKAKWHPNVYAFGTYNPYVNGQTPLDPTWMAGVGVRFTIFSNIDRVHSTNAARQAAREAEEAVAEMTNTVNIATRQAYLGIENARTQYQLLSSTLDSARENLRVQEAAFREGEGTSQNVSDARIALRNALVEQAAAAFKFDLEMANLLHASGQMQRFTDYMNRADKIIGNGTSSEN